MVLEVNIRLANNIVKFIDITCLCEVFWTEFGNDLDRVPE